MRTFQHSLIYHTDDPQHKQWAISTARMQALKELLTSVVLGWTYTSRYEETYTTVRDCTTYTFSIHIDEEPVL